MLRSVTCRALPSVWLLGGAWRVAPPWSPGQATQPHISLDGWPPGRQGQHTCAHAGQQGPGASDWNKRHRLHRGVVAGSIRLAPSDPNLLHGFISPHLGLELEPRHVAGHAVPCAGTQKLLARRARGGEQVVVPRPRTGREARARSVCESEGAEVLKVGRIARALDGRTRKQLP